MQNFSFITAPLLHVFSLRVHILFQPEVAVHELKSYEKYEESGHFRRAGDGNPLP